jgi:hypothetical protein
VNVSEDDIGRLRADFERVLGHRGALANEDGDA